MEDTRQFARKYRDKKSAEYHDLVVRLNKIEGQVRGIKRMLENDRTCEDIIIQISAAQMALGSFNRQLITQHIRDCAAEDIRNGGNDAIVELAGLIYRVLRDDGVVKANEVVEA